MNPMPGASGRQASSTRSLGIARDDLDTSTAPAAEGGGGRSTPFPASDRGPYWLFGFQP